ncbi:ATP-binding protein [Aquabacterium humicola]|uniref:ATP-binding protein n=1 Tax=Aquabacterium humicola TaxID=3237377 RepID=UPI002542CDC7|nr:ATP-binding protein [Rubrivivax pictus]
MPRHLHRACASALLGLAAVAAGAGPLEDWRAQAERVRALADNDVPRAHAEALGLQQALPPDATLADRAKALNVRARTETYLGMTEAAARHAGEAFALASQAHDRVGQAESDLVVVLNSINQGRLDELVKATQRAVVTLEGVTDRPDLLAEAMLRLAVMYRRFEQIDESVQVAMQTMEIARRSGHPMALVLAHQGLALAYGQSGRQGESLDHLEQARLQARKVPTRMLEAFATAGMAGDLRNRGDLERAEQLAREALAMHREVGAPFAISFGLYGLADVLSARGRPQEALQLLDESVGIYDRHPNPIGQWFSLNARSATYQALGDPARALADAQRGYGLAQQLGHPVYLSGSASRLSALAAKAGDFKRAYELAVEAAQMTSKAVRDKAGARMLQLTQRYESESKQRAIDELRRQTEQQQAQLRQRELQQRWLWTLLAAVAMALAGAALHVRRSRQAQRALQALNEQLQASENAVRALNTELEQRVNQRTDALRRQARYLRTLIDMLPMWTWFKDTGSRYLVTNRAHAQAHRREVDEVIGRTDAELQADGAAQASLADDAEVMASGRRMTVEQAVGEGDATRWMEVFKAPVSDEDGTLLGTVGVARDISAQKAAEAARESALAEAERLAQLRSDFLARMSHELRTPLSGILGFAELLRTEAPLGERQERCVRIIQQSGQHLLNLINDLLDMSRIDAGRLELHPTPVRLAGFVHAVGDIVAVKAEQKGLRVAVELAPGLPEAVRLDDLRLRQVLLNLLSNAVKFCDAGQVTLRVGRAAAPGAASRPGEALRFEVEDSGIGMTPQQLSKLFQPFEQVAADGARRQGGTGLGLAISRQLVRLMGGDIQVDSAPGAGSRFWFELVLAPCAAPEASAAPPAPASVAMADPALGTAPAPAPAVAAAAGHGAAVPTDEPLPLPALPQLRELQRLARMGDMRQLREYSQQLQQADPGLAAFAQHVHALAQDFRSQAISAFVDFHADRATAAQSRTGG